MYLLIFPELAKNRLINPKDAHIVRALMEKGLVIKDNGFHPFNHSFRRYVLTFESSPQINQWKKKQLKSWGNVRTPLVTILIGITLFIFVTQRQTFNQGIAWISAFVAGIPTLLRFIGLFRSGADKSPQTPGS